MSMKKYLKHFSFLLVIGLVLAACSVDDSESNASGEGKVEMEVWYGLGSEADEKMKELISDLNEEHEDIEVTAVPQADYDETYEKLQAAIASDTASGGIRYEYTAHTDCAGRNALEQI